MTREARRGREAADAVRYPREEGFRGLDDYFETFYTRAVFCVLQAPV
jgi:hypothetical protein